jgi:hypothetical protein
MSTLRRRRPVATPDPDPDGPPVVAVAAFPTRCAPILAVLVALLAPTRLAGQPAPAGSLQRVDLGLCCPEAPRRFEVSPAVAALAGGGYVVVWEHRLQGIIEPYPGYEQVRGRRLDPAGIPVGAEIQVADHGGEYPYYSLDVAALTGGGFVVVWTSGFATFDVRVRARVFDREGEPLGPAQPVAEDPASYGNSPRVTGLADGGFAVVWASAGSRLRRFDAQGSPRGGELSILPAGTSEPDNPVPDVVAVEAGGFVALATRKPADPGGAYETLVRWFDPQGRPVGEPLPVASGGGRVIGLPGGGFAVLTDSVQRFDPMGQPVGAPVPHDLGYTAAAVGDDLPHPAAAAGDDGSLFLTGLTGADIGGRYLAVGSSSFVPVAGIRGDTWHYEAESDVAAGTDGSFVVVWVLEALLGERPEDETGLGVLAQRFVADAPGRLEPGLRQRLVREGAGAVEIPVVRTGGSRGELTAGFSVQGVEAEADVDFGVVQGTLTFPDGDSIPRTIVVPVFDDARIERAETFRVRLDTVTEGVPRQDEVTVEIRDDDRTSPLDSGPSFALGDAADDLPRQGVFPLQVAADRQGGFVVAWDPSSGGEQLTEVLRFDAEGRVSADLQLVPVQDYLRRVRGLAASPSGFAVSWRVTDPIYGFVEELYFFEAQRFDLPGVATGPPSQVDGHALAMLPDGGMAVASEQDDGDGPGVFVDAPPPGGRGLRSFRVNEDPAGPQVNPDLAADAKGDLTVVWETVLPSRPGGDIVLRRFDTQGTPLTPEIRVTPPEMRQAEGPQLAVDSQGRIAVLWWGEDAVGRGLFLRGFRASGEPAGEPVRVDAAAGSIPYYPRGLALRDDGVLLVTHGRDGEAVGQTFVFPGVAVGNEIGDLPGSAVAVGPSGPFLVAGQQGGEIRALPLDRPPLAPRRLLRSNP